MRALSLWQPWAALIAVGAKRVETRHWPAPASLVGERIAIHAAKRKTHVELARIDPRFERYLAEVELPLGAIVCTAVIEWCEPVTIVLRTMLTEHELAFGDYTRGRYAWGLCDVVPLEEPVPWRGMQGIFDVPDALLGTAAA